MWLPILRFFGFFKLTFFRHSTILSGVGVGGGSLGYSNVLQIPTAKFFQAASWAYLADWEFELKPYYETALKIMGAAESPRLEVGDRALQELAKQIGKADHFQRTNVAIYFGEPDITVEDPYFGGNGPDRRGCNFCGGCMTGCRYNAKNTLDKNYLYFAQKNGVVIQAESQVYDVIPINRNDGSQGYKIHWKSSTKIFKKKGEFTTRAVIFSGGVLGTVKLLLKLKESSLGGLSDKMGCNIRTNSESLCGVTTFNKHTEFSNGISIGSILHTDENSHLEPVRYSAGSGFWRILMSPLVFGRNIFFRFLNIIYNWLRYPIQNLRVFLIDDFAKRTQILLFMRTIESTLRFSRGLFGMKSNLETGSPPTAFIPDAKKYAEQYSKIVNGKPVTLITETLFGMPTTAHILGGAVMGKDVGEGVIDKDNHVFGYENLYICDGSMISANPGVNPSLTIMALTERAMSKIPSKVSSVNN
jgi:cholesterol oxidase